MAATEATIDIASSGTGQKLEVLFARLATDGIEIGIRERVMAARIVAALAIERDAGIAPDERAFLLRARLTPLLAKTPQDVASIRNAFRDVFRGDGGQPPPAPPPLRPALGPALPLSLRTAIGADPAHRARTAVVAVVLLVATAIAGYHWLAPVPTPPPPVDNKTTQPIQSGTSQASALAATPSAGQPLTADEVDALVKRIVAAAGPSRTVSIAELASQMSGADPAGASTRALVSLFERYLSRAPDQAFVLTELELTDLIDALATRQYAGRTAAPDAVATAFAAAGLDKLAVTATGAAAPPLPPPAETLFIPAWLTGALLALPALPLAGWTLGRRRRLKDYLRRRTPQRPPLIHELVIRASADVVRERTTLTRAALRLGRARQGLSRAIDIEATVLATARGAGFPHIVFAPARMSPDYLVLISTKGPEDHAARQLDQLCTELAAQNLSITRYFIAQDANLCFEAPEASYFTLDQLAARYPDHRLIFLGAGDQLVNPGTLAAWPWAEDLASWERRAILTPKPIEEWGRQEVALARLFDSPPLRADSAGLLRLAEQFERQEGPGAEQLMVRGDPIKRSWISRPRRWLAPMAPEGPELAQLEGELARYFVDDRGGFDRAAFCWCAACAIYPALRWDLTVYLGLKLKAPGADGTFMQPLYSEERALRLAALPWFREGFMPDWLRRRLLGLLPRNMHVQAAALLRDLLDRAVSSEGEAFDALHLRIAQDRPDPVAGRPERDEIFLDALARSDPLGLEAPRSLRQLIVGVRHTFVAREWAALAVIAIYSIAMMWLVPWPSSGALATGIGLPLELLPLVLVTWPLARRIAGPARTGKRG